MQIKTQDKIVQNVLRKMDERSLIGQKKYGATSKGKSILAIEKEKLEKDWISNIYYIKIMSELLNITQDELLKIIKLHLQK